MGLEAGGGAPYGGRQLHGQGAPGNRPPPRHVVAFRRGQKNDYHAARALGEAVRPPAVRGVPLKRVAQRAWQVRHRVRTGRVRQRTAVVHRVRGL